MKWDQDVAGAIGKYRGGPWDDAIDELLDAPLIEVGGVIRFRADGGSIVAGRIGRVATLFDGWLNTDLTGWEIKEEADLRLEFSDEVFVFLDWLEEQGEPISQWLRNDAAYAINREDVIQWRRRQMVASCDVSIGQSFGCVYSTEFTGSCVIVWLFEDRLLP